MPPTPSGAASGPETPPGAPPRRKLTATERAWAHANAAPSAAPSVVDAGPPLADAEVHALLADRLGAVVVEDWRRTPDGTWRDHITGRTTANP